MAMSEQKVLATAANPRANFWTAFCSALNLDEINWLPSPRLDIQRLDIQPAGPLPDFQRPADASSAPW
jgi:hypothetical protein